MPLTTEQINALETVLDNPKLVEMVRKRVALEADLQAVVDLFPYLQPNEKASLELALESPVQLQKMKSSLQSLRGKAEAKPTLPDAKDPPGPKPPLKPTKPNPALTKKPDPIVPPKATESTLDKLRRLGSSKPGEQRQDSHQQGKPKVTTSIPTLPSSTKAASPYEEALQKEKAALQRLKNAEVAHANHKGSAEAMRQAAIDYYAIKKNRLGFEAQMTLTGQAAQAKQLRAKWGVE